MSNVKEAMLTDDPKVEKEDKMKMVKFATLSPPFACPFPKAVEVWIAFLGTCVFIVCGTCVFVVVCHGLMQLIDSYLKIKIKNKSVVIVYFLHIYTIRSVCDLCLIIFSCDHKVKNR